ncbi:MAG: hypothetical protein IJ035_05175 [Oscillospiraceae bacterium]|nr:hypothetical protein [Oscillospiraceae bacterium]
MEVELWEKDAEEQQARRTLISELLSIDNEHQNCYELNFNDTAYYFYEAIEEGDFNENQKQKTFYCTDCCCSDFDYFRCIAFRQIR